MKPIKKIDLVDLACDLKLGAEEQLEKMTKPNLIKLIGKERIDTYFNYTTEPSEVDEFKGLVVDGVIFKKTWETKSKQPKGGKQLYIGVFISDDQQVYVVRRSAQGNGIGKGGPRWHTVASPV